MNEVRPADLTPSQLEDTGARRARRHIGRAVTGVVVAAGLLVLKLKGLILLFAGKFKPFFVNPFEGFGVAQTVTTAVSMGISIAAYAFKAGWPLAVGATLLIAIHEMGHAVMMRARGIRPSAMVFIPFVGGAVTPKDEPRSAYIDAQIGLAGPLVGALASWACLKIYQFNGDSLYLTLGYFGFLINLFNLIPTAPLDGGRISGAITKWMWVFGGAFLLGYTILNQNPLMILVLILMIFQIRKAVKGETAPGFYDVTLSQRAFIAGIYFALLLTVAFFVSVSHAELQRLASLE